MKFKIKPLLCLTSIASAFLITNAYSQNTSNADFSKWSVFADSIQNCTPGTFQLPNYVLQAMQQVAGTSPSSSAPPLNYQIIGWQAGKCQLKVVMSTPSGLATTQPNTISLNCAIPQDSLKSIADSAAKIATGNFTSSTDDAVSKMMNDSCTQANQ